jgi:hypothetical protein
MRQRSAPLLGTPCDSRLIPVTLCRKLDMRSFVSFGDHPWSKPPSESSAPLRLSCWRRRSPMCLLRRRRQDRPPAARSRMSLRAAVATTANGTPPSSTQRLARKSARLLADPSQPQRRSDLARGCSARDGDYWPASDPASPGSRHTGRAESARAPQADMTGGAATCSCNRRFSPKNRRTIAMFRAAPNEVLAEREAAWAAELTPNMAVLGDPLPGRSALDAKHRTSPP